MKNEEVSMNEEVCIDLTNTLKKIKKALDSMDANKLKELSNHTIHCSSIYHEKRPIYIAIITYSLSKIIEKAEIRKKYTEEFEDFMKGIIQNFEMLITFLEKRDFKKFNKAIKVMLKEISEFDSSFGRYAEDVLEFAKAQKGAKIYEHGLSLSSVAEMLGISKWELMEKVGETKIHEEILTPKSVKERLERMKKLIEK